MSSSNLMEFPTGKTGILNQRRIIHLCLSFVFIIFMFFCVGTFTWTSPSPNTNFRPAALMAGIDVHFLEATPIANDTADIATNPNLYDIPLFVHYVLLHDTNTPTSGKNSVTFSACLSVLSVIKNLQPTAIYLHTNYPDFWPFDTCNDVIVEWSPIKMIPAGRTFVTNGTRIKRIEHEADIIKYSVVEMYGGLVLDFDVYVIDGEGIRTWLVDYPCIACHEGNEVAGEGNKARINAGFFGCLQNHARFPQLVLKESYEMDFHPNEWIWNSGITPLKILEENDGVGVLVDDVCNNPAWLYVSRFNLERGRYNWTDRKAFHSYYKSPSFTKKELAHLNSTLGDMLRWILYDTLPDDETSMT